MSVASSVEIIRHVVDADCPECDFPELVKTVAVQSDDGTGKSKVRVLSIECSSRKCPWIEKGEVAK